MLRAHIIFTGMVQGVGFRFTVQRQAQALGVNGWVRNRPDGSVEILAEGARDKIEEMCRNIERHFDGCIRDRNDEFAEARDEFDDFRIVT